MERREGRKGGRGGGRGGGRKEGRKGGREGGREGGAGTWAVSSLKYGDSMSPPRAEAMFLLPLCGGREDGGGTTNTLEYTCYFFPCPRPSLCLLLSLPPSLRPSLRPSLLPVLPPYLNVLISPL